MRLSQILVCIFCGCFELIACEGGCSWLSKERCSRCAGMPAHRAAPKDRTWARRILAGWFTEITQLRPEGGGRRRAGLVLTTLPVLPRHRTIVLEQLRGWTGNGPAAASSMEARIAYNPRPGRWDLVGPWQHLLMDVAAAQKALQGWEKR